MLRYPVQSRDPGNLTAPVLKAPTYRVGPEPCLPLLSHSAAPQANHLIYTLQVPQDEASLTLLLIITTPLASELSSTKSPLPLFVFGGLIFIPLLSSEWDFLFYSFSHAK